MTTTTTQFKVQGNKLWQNSQFMIPVLAEGDDTAKIITIKAKEGSSWGFGKEGYFWAQTINKTDLNGYIFDTNKDGSITLTKKYIGPKNSADAKGWTYGGPDSRVGQLLVRIGENGPIFVLGTNKLRLDPTCNDSDFTPNNDGEIMVNPRDYQNQTLYFSMNDKTGEYGDNSGAVEVECTTTEIDTTKTLFFSKTYLVLAAAEWQNTGVKANAAVLQNAHSFKITVTAEDGAIWSFGGPDYTVNADGFYVTKGEDGKFIVTDKYYVCSATQTPYAGPDTKVGQLIYKIGVNGESKGLGTTTLALNSAETTKYNDYDTIFLRINDHDGYTYDNSGEIKVKIEFEIYLKGLVQLDQESKFELSALLCNETPIARRGV
jgi:hypothetical protein